MYEYCTQVLSFFKSCTRLRVRSTVSVTFRGRGASTVGFMHARGKNREANLNDCHPFGRDRCCTRHSLDSACWVRTDHAQEKSRRSRWRSTSLPAPRRAAVAAQWVCLVAMPARIQRQSGGTSPRAGHQHTRHRLLRFGCQWHATQALR
jgi:hypothetical protein